MKPQQCKRVKRMRKNPYRRTQNGSATSLAAFGLLSTVGVLSFAFHYAHTMAIKSELQWRARNVVIAASTVAYELNANPTVGVQPDANENLCELIHAGAEIPIAEDLTNQSEGCLNEDDELPDVIPNETLANTLQVLKNTAAEVTFMNNGNFSKTVHQFPNTITIRKYANLPAGPPDMGVNAASQSPFGARFASGFAEDGGDNPHYQAPDDMPDNYIDEGGSYPDQDLSSSMEGLAAMANNSTTAAQFMGAIAQPPGSLYAEAIYGNGFERLNPAACASLCSTESHPMIKLASDSWLENHAAVAMLKELQKGNSSLLKRLRGMEVEADGGNIKLTVSAEVDTVFSNLVGGPTTISVTAAAERGGVVVVPIVDTSGSMGWAVDSTVDIDPVIEYVMSTGLTEEELGSVPQPKRYLSLAAILTLIDTIDANRDCIGFVTYGSTVQEHRPIRCNITKEQMREDVFAIPAPAGATNGPRPAEVARTMFQNATIPDGHRKFAFYLTDGKPNAGHAVQQHHNEIVIATINAFHDLKRDGVAVTAVGIGQSCNREARNPWETRNCGIDSSMLAHVANARDYALARGIGDYPPLEVRGASFNDADGDEVSNNKDNCLYTKNPSQLDTDNDGVGNACDCSGAAAGTPICTSPSDVDLDGVSNQFDNCPAVYNPDQEASDTPGVGAACEWVQIDMDPPLTWDELAEETTMYAGNVMINPGVMTFFSFIQNMMTQFVSVQVGSADNCDHGYCAP